MGLWMIFIDGWMFIYMDIQRVDKSSWWHMLWPNPPGTEIHWRYNVDPYSLGLNFREDPQKKKKNEATATLQDAVAQTSSRALRKSLVGVSADPPVVADSDDHWLSSCDDSPVTKRGWLENLRNPNGGLKLGTCSNQIRMIKHGGFSS